MILPEQGFESAQIERLTSSIRNYVRSRMRNAVAADDVTQEVLLKISRNISSLVRDERLDAWAFQIARNTISDYFRSAKPSEEFQEEIHADSYEDTGSLMAKENESMRAELATYIRSEVELLPLLYRDALLCTEYEGLSQTELAKHLGLPLSTIKSRVQRAREMLRKRMEQCCRWAIDPYGTVVDVTRNDVPATCACDKSLPTEK